MKQNHKLLTIHTVISLFFLVNGVFTVFGNPDTAEKGDNGDLSCHHFLEQAETYKDSLPDSMLYYCNKALQIAVNKDLKGYQAKCYQLKGYYYRKHNDRKKSLQFLKIASQLYDDLGDYINAGKLYRRQALLFEQNGQVDSSIIMIDKAIEMFEASGDSIRLASTWLSRGGFYEARGDYDQALKDKMFALEINMLINNKPGIASAYNNLGVLYFYMSDYEQSIANILKSIRIKEEIGEKPSLLSAYINIGSIYQISEDFNNALIYYDKAMELAKELGEFFTVTSALNNKGLVYQELHKNKQAIASFKEAISIARKYHFQRNLYIALGNMGLIYASENKHNEALKWYNQALKLKIESGDKREAAKTLINIGESLLSQKKPEQAIQRFLQSIDMATSIADLQTLFEGHIGLSEAYKQKGQYMQALDHYMQYSTLKDSVYNIETSQEIAELQTQYETEKKEAQIKELQQEQEIQDLGIQKQQSELTTQRLIFFSIAIVLILAIFIGILLFSRYRLKQQNLRNNLRKKQLEIEQRLLRSQINPHFIFNALNSIQSFMAENNTMSGLSYLSKFARLMRLILENSRLPFVGLDAEIESLKLNLELERMRFEERFDFRIEIDEQIETEFIEIPPMIAQPFVENAVLHAFPEDLNNGLIELKYEIYNNMLRCTIKDNGIGRQASTKEKKPIDKNSLGMQLTSERIELMRKNTGQEVHMHVNDLKDSNGKACGTEVIVDLPMQEA